MIVRRARRAIVLPRRGVTGLLYEVRDDARMRDHRNVTGIDLNSRRPHTLRHEALLLGVDRLVFLRPDIPARLGFPGRNVHFCLEQLRVCRTLSRVDQILLELRQVAGKIRNGVPVQPDVTVDPEICLKMGAGSNFALNWAAVSPASGASAAT
jgi:hypothetical protein